MSKPIKKKNRAIFILKWPRFFPLMVKKRQRVGGRESGGRGAAVLAGLSFYGWERGTLTVSNLYQVGNEFQFRKSARGHGYRLSGLGEERERRKEEA